MHVPYFKLLEKFYFFYLPILIEFLFIYSIASLIKPKFFSEYIFLALIMFAPSTLLVLERGNNDILIFLFIILFVYINSSILNFTILSLACLIKYYPLALMVNFFIEHKRSAKQIIIILFLFIVIVTFFFYFTGESFELVQKKMKMISPTWGNQFSIKAFAIISKKLINYSYATILLISYILFFILMTFFFKIFKRNNFIDKIEIYSTEEKLFILGGNLIISVYLIAHNVHYREIFLILLLPFIIKLTKTFENKIFKYLLYFIIFRYVFFIVSNYFILFQKHYYLLYMKAFSDLILISCFASLCFILNIEILKNTFLKKNEKFNLNQ